MHNDLLLYMGRPHASAQGEDFIQGMRNPSIKNPPWRVNRMLSFTRSHCFAQHPAERYRQALTGTLPGGWFSFLQTTEKKPTSGKGSPRDNSHAG